MSSSARHPMDISAQTTQYIRDRRLGERTATTGSWVDTGSEAKGRSPRLTQPEG